MKKEMQIPALFLLQFWIQNSIFGIKIDSPIDAAKGIGIPLDFICADILIGIYTWKDFGKFLCGNILCRQENDN